MIKIIILAVVLGVASAQYRPQYNQYNPEARTGDHYATITRSENENAGTGYFRYGYDTSNGIRADAEGFIKNPNSRSEDQIQVIQGSYSYYGPDGQLYTVTYIADENGFQPQGAHLPSNGAAYNAAYQRPLPVRPYRRQ